jgi:hypothetical protein
MRPDADKTIVLVPRVMTSIRAGSKVAPISCVTLFMLQSPAFTGGSTPWHIGRRTLPARLHPSDCLWPSDIQ